MPLLLVLACDTQDEDQPCQAPDDPVPLTYSISLVGFPLGEADPFVGGEELDFDGLCVLEEMDFAAGQLTLSLACDHPAPTDPDGASVTITTAAAGVPKGVAIGDELTFEAAAILIENTGGDASGPIFRAGENTGPESYELSNADGLVFGAVVNNLSASFEPIVVSWDYDCPDWMPCSGNQDPIAAHLEVSVGETKLDVHVGDVAPLESGDLAWDLSLFAASLHDSCHSGETGDFSVVRRPE